MTEHALHSRQYGAIARVGLVVPPANSTVEPELATLIPDAGKLALYTARLTGTVGPDIDAGILERVAQYDAALPEVADSLKGLQLDVAWLGHTAMSYVSEGDETRLLEGLSRSRATHVVTAVGVIREALDAMACKRLVVVSAYPDALTEIARAYWTAQGREPADVVTLKGDPSIFAVRPEQVVRAVHAIRSSEADAILVSGTGIPTLRALDALADHAVPVLSANLCFAWWIYRRFPQATGPAAPPCLRRLTKATGSTG